MRAPRDDEHHLIAGHNGSGKTHEALHWLSQRSIDTLPWVVIDFKGDDLVAQIPVTAPLSLDDPIPTDPGVYVMPAKAEDGERDGRVDLWLRQVVDRGHCGVLIDEGMRLGQHNIGLRNLMTGGRSKQCPCIFVTQRPAFIDTCALSEPAYLQTFLLPHPDDQERIAKWIPRDRFSFQQLIDRGKHHSLAFEIRTNRLEFLGPAPPFQDIYDRILTRLPRYEDPPLPRASAPPRRARV